MAVVQIELIGDVELYNRLLDMPAKNQRRVLYPALRKGVRRMAHVIKQRTPRGKTGNLKKSVGSAVRTKGSKGVVVAKAGFDVGRKPLGGKGASVENVSSHVSKRLGSHGHLLTLGTRKRYTGAKTIYSKTKKDSVNQRKKVTGKESTGKAVRYTGYIQYGKYTWVRDAEAAYKQACIDIIAADGRKRIKEEWEKGTGRRFNEL